MVFVGSVICRRVVHGRSCEETNAISKHRAALSNRDCATVSAVIRWHARVQFEKEAPDIVEGVVSWLRWCRVVGGC